MAAKKQTTQEPKQAASKRSYGGNTFFTGKPIKSNNQCKRCGTMDARDTKHK